MILVSLHCLQAHEAIMVFTLLTNKHAKNKTKALVGYTE